VKICRSISLKREQSNRQKSSKTAIRDARAVSALSKCLQRKKRKRQSNNLTIRILTDATSLLTKLVRVKKAAAVAVEAVAVAVVVDTAAAAVVVEAAAVVAAVAAAAEIAAEAAAAAAETIPAGKF
jgi:hypothetical protein